MRHVPVQQKNMYATSVVYEELIILDVVVIVFGSDDLAKLLCQYFIQYGERIGSVYMANLLC